MRAELLFVGLTACGLDTLSPTADSETEAGPENSASPHATLPLVNHKADLRFKGPERLVTDLASVLELDREFCIEPDGSTCLDVHRVTLGGIEPYESSVYDPSPKTRQTAVLAAERVALHACGERVLLDANSPASAEVFPGLGGGPTDENRREAATTLVQRAFLREPTPEELDAYTGFESSGKEWALGVCFAALTSTEFLFY